MSSVPLILGWNNWEAVKQGEIPRSKKYSWKRKLSLEEIFLGINFVDEDYWGKLVNSERNICTSENGS